MTVEIIVGDARTALATLEPESVHACVTSPPYFGLRDYGNAEQIGLEETPADYIEQLVLVFREVRRVLRRDGTVWLNIGESYAANRGYQVESFKGGRKHGKAQAVGGRGQKAADYGLKPKDLMGIPWRVALALQADGWYLRQDIIWHKPNVMPESVIDRCAGAHEYIFLLSKSGKYHFDYRAIEETATCDRTRGPAEHGDKVSTNGNGGLGRRKSGGTKRKRSVWTVPTVAYTGSHFATFPPALIRDCILAGCPVGGTVLDPFGGAGTTGLVCEKLGRNSILIEIIADYAAMARSRLKSEHCDVTAHGVHDANPGPLFGDAI